MSPLLSLGLAASLTATYVTANEVGPSVVSLEKTDQGFQLLRNGIPLRLNGAVVDDATALPDAPARPVAERLRQLKDAGANAARLAANRETLELAHRLGIAAVVDILLDGERDGLDWNNEDQVAAQTARVLEQIQRLKDIPSVTLWILGNELDYIPPDEPFNPRLWERLNTLAAQVKAIDPNHPVLTIIGFSRFEEKVKRLARDAHAIDLLGLNAYGQLGPAIDILKAHWPKPFIVTEWGPTGHWEVPRTRWQAPLEQTSREKAESIRIRYESILKPASSHCLGSFAFFWSEKQETTHTWYGLFHEGQYTASIDALHTIWKGSPPANRSPDLISLLLNGQKSDSSLVLSGGSVATARVDAADPDGDPLSYQWEIRPEVFIPSDNYAGRKEKRASPLPAVLASPLGAEVQLRIPQEPGQYRVFVTVSDSRGSTAYANFPFLVAGQPATPSPTTSRHL
ncbi:hypothetical protein [Nibricoccus sp. IMCC34717]|uniref:hypothetical protein n=1 Tax=Nibricoccus sp. IMCC34717 TaxID=3034021 RepID=UPI00384F3EBA